MTDELTPPEGLVNEEQLKAWTGYTRRTDVRKFLEEKLGLKVMLGKGGRICCTLVTINEAMRPYRKAGVKEDIEFIK